MKSFQKSLSAVLRPIIALFRSRHADMSGANGAVPPVKNKITYWGGDYEGETKNGKPHGRGIEVSPIGYRYEGEFKEGRKDGRGTYTYPDGRGYTGEFKKGWEDGKGIQTYADGSKLEGEFRQGILHGNGIYTHANSDRYEICRARYTFIFIRLLRDTGSQLSNKDRNCKNGVLLFPSGTKYEGEFRNGEFHGRGVLTFKSGYTYQGEFRDGRYHGTGLLASPDGRIYEGGFKDGKKYGFGKYIYANRPTYEGEFRAGQRYGKGVLIESDCGIRREGEFQYNSMNGVGMVRFPSGSWYKGRLIDGTLRELLEVKGADVIKESCSCLDDITFPSRLREIGTIGCDPTNGRCADIELTECLDCGRCWIRYRVQYESYSGSGRWFMGSISADKAMALKPEEVPDYLESLDWHYCGGSYYGGSGKSSGKIHADLWGSLP